MNSSDLRALVAGNSEFAFDLYGAVRGEGGNLFYSPHSISLALAMTYAGARNETERQMAETLGFRLSQDVLHSGFNALEMELASRGESASGIDGKAFKLNIANAVWGRKDCEFLPDFLDVLAENYGAGVRLLDFAGSPEASRRTINGWVSDQTEEKIKDLIPEGGIDSGVVMALTNAIYFNGAWFHPFARERTRDLPFHLIDGDTVDTPMMGQTKPFGYFDGDGYQALQLFYDGGELSMVILLPERGKFGEFEESLNADLLGSVIDGIRSRPVILTMPKFELNTEFSLSSALAEMGMPDAFDETRADFSGMGADCAGGGGRPFLSSVIHKAFVTVEEEGTEAAAATGVLIVATSIPPPPISVSVDRPFIFLIRDHATGAILFMGRVMDPRR